MYSQQQLLITETNQWYSRETEEVVPEFGEGGKRTVVPEFGEGGTACLGWLAWKNAQPPSIRKIHRPD